MTIAIRTLLLLFCALSAAVCQSPRLPLEQIVARHIEAIGGIEKIHALRSYVKRGMYHEPGPFPPDTKPVARNYMAFMRPYYEVIGDPADPNPRLREGFDGSAWEYYGDPGVMVRTVGAAAAATRHTADFLQDPLVDYQEKGNRLQLERTERIGDRQTYRILVTLADGAQRNVFVDIESFLIIAGRGVAPIHAFGNAVAMETRFEDFRSVNGVLFPFRTLETEIESGKIFSEGRVVSIEANSVDDPAIFSPATRQQTPLQKCLEQLYMERSDPVAVMYSYRLFRRIHPEVDTREGVEFIGYQMSKMSDFKGSIELLKANAEDYPNSASAQYGLGRAYKAAGELEAAKQAFANALKIDSNFKKATDGLNALR
jgi:hypothetical protein